MGNEQEDCGICLEARDNLRMLPCFHVGCMTCILRMTTGHDRAVPCHICRELCLIKNIRSLPRPVRCETCKNIVKNPKMFPCCDRLHCLFCITKTAMNDGRVLCPYSCSDRFHNVENLPRARICRTCFCLNTDLVPRCGHAMCLTCQSSKQRGCPLCSAMGNPHSTAVNPGQPTSGHANSAFRRVMQQQPRQLDQMRLQAAYQIIARQLQEHAEQQQQQQHQQQLVVGFLHSMEERIKELAFFVILLVFGFFTGLSHWLWLVGGVSLLFLQPSTIQLKSIHNHSRVLLFSIFLYQYFWPTVGLSVYTKVVISIFNFLRNKFHVSIDENSFLVLAADGVELQILYNYMRPFIWNRMALTCCEIFIFRD